MLQRRGQRAAVQTWCQHGAEHCAILGGAGGCRDPPEDGRSHSPSRVSAKASRGSAEKTICHSCWGTREATALQARWKAVTRLLLLRPSVSRAAASQVLQGEIGMSDASCDGTAQAWMAATGCCLTGSLVGAASLQHPGASPTALGWPRGSV